jgi:hypothetical protein
MKWEKEHNLNFVYATPTTTYDPSEIYKITTNYRAKST